MKPKQAAVPATQAATPATPAAPAPPAASGPQTFVSVPFDMKGIPRGDEIPMELYDNLRQIRQWRDRSANSTILVG